MEVARNDLLTLLLWVDEAFERRCREAASIPPSSIAIAARVASALANAWPKGEGDRERGVAIRLCNTLSCYVAFE